ncbi:MAG: methyltransferase domain-containing protein [Chitinophagaceae bacterium]|nr:MAG: methyltransferase domain-containing protein [Chitinophagaceae bacterium]
MSSAAAYSGSVPEHYEEGLGPILFEPFARDLAKRLPVAASDLLELACGTGRLTRHLLLRLPRGGSLSAIDLNGDMLTVARRVLPDPRIKWLEADAGALPFAEAAFDAVLCQFGLIFFPDRGAALREARRVLRPGGRLLLNTWGSMRHNPRAGIIADVLHETMGAEAPDFLSVGPYSLYDESEIYGLLEAAGFRNIRIEKVALESSCSDPEALIRGYVDGSPLGAYLDRKRTGLRADIREKLLAAYEAQASAYGQRVPMRALVAEGCK